MRSRVILVAMLPPSGATRCDLLATMVDTTPRTGTANLARTLFSRPLAIWTPVRGVLRGRGDGDALLSPFTYAVHPCRGDRCGRARDHLLRAGCRRAVGPGALCGPRFVFQTASPGPCLGVLFEYGLGPLGR